MRASRIPMDWPGPTYVVRAVFRVPLPFAYRWCTDYTKDDAHLEGEKYQRKILRRSSREVVYEDLEDSREGWFWTRHVVRLFPPDRWHSESVGSHREIWLDYRLTPLSGNRTQMVLTARRRPSGVGGKNPAKAGWERSVGLSWKHFARFMERDYRSSVAQGRRP